MKEPSKGLHFAEQQYVILGLLVMLPLMAHVLVLHISNNACVVVMLPNMVCKSCCNNPSDDIVIRFSLRLHCVVCCPLPQNVHACRADSLGTTAVYDVQTSQWFQQS